MVPQALNGFLGVTVLSRPRRVTCMSFSAFVVDIDGVLLRGSEPVEGAPETVAELRRHGRVLFLTNNSTRSRAQHAEKLCTLGIEAREEEVLSSAYAAARYVAERHRRAYVIGERGLREELRRCGVGIGGRRCGAVVVGLDRRFTYGKLARALRHLLEGAELVATNRDRTLITEHGLIPGAGAVVAAVEVASGKRATVAGKPSEIMAKLVLERLEVEPSRVLLIGDKVETDIAMGRRLGMRTALVSEGARGQADHVLESITQVRSLL